MHIRNNYLIMSYKPLSLVMIIPNKRLYFPECVTSCYNQSGNIQQTSWAYIFLFFHNDSGLHD